MNKDNETLIYNCLTQNPRMSFTEISRRTGIPCSTVFDCWKKMQKKYVINIKPV